MGAPDGTTLSTPNTAGEGSTAKTPAAAFFAEDALPKQHAGHVNWTPLLFELHRGELEPPYIDGVSQLG